MTHPTTRPPPDPVTAASAWDLVESLRRRCPSLFYQPHDHGQVQFHQSTHTVRCLFPGNGFGKTRAVGTEAAWWIDHKHPYQTTPSWPIVAIWYCALYSQYEVLRPQLEEECLSAGWTWNEQKHRYEWPNDGRLYVFSCDTDWRGRMGFNPDLVIFDEQPPLALWREMTMRRRGKRSTRYCFAATAVDGESWMETEFYHPWLEHHKAAGVGLTQARQVQTHPRYWLWEIGGIDDNPGANADQRAWFHERTWSSAEEKRVRLRGGFGRFNGMPVFDAGAMSRMLDEITAAEQVRGRSRLCSLVTSAGASA